MTILWKAVDPYFTEVLFVFQFYPVCNFGNIFDLALSGVKCRLRSLLPCNTKVVTLSLMVELA